ncbi:MAG: elongation factor 4 [Elusimicrobia bacterium]|nr:elongation factor 4 [Elusimicrobiota bacterium]
MVRRYMDSLIRNFSIIAHIDHGKSTLADRLLELTETVPKRQMREQVLDQMELERERGITIKAKAVRMRYRYQNRTYLLNLIDTPGHVDFSYEVSRALRACEGVLLVVDASQGVEAQTLSNAHLAQEAGLAILPVLNKMDLPQADLEGTQKQLEEVLGIHAKPLALSAKDGRGVPELLEAILQRIPPPKQSSQAELAALVFDSFYDPYRGVVLLVRVFSGSLRTGMAIRFFSSGFKAFAQELGYLELKFTPAESLQAGEVGYVIAGTKDMHQIRVGDTLMDVHCPLRTPLPGYQELKPFVFAGFYPVNPGDYENLRSAFQKLHLSDASFVYQTESSRALGFGFRVGFLGLLHMEITKERLEREFHLSLIATSPNVSYRVKSRTPRLRADPHASPSGWTQVDNPAEFPPHGEIEEVQEPYVRALIVLAQSHLGAVLQLLKDHRGKHHSMRYLSPQRILLEYELPLAEMILDFYDRLKSVSKGYASLDYEPIGYQPGDLTRLEILIHEEPVDALSFILPREKAYLRARELVEKLKELIPRQYFEVPIQGKIAGRVIARETIPALRKDVLAKCYGGDVTRKRKLLEKQKEGRKRMKQVGKVELPQEAFLAILKLHT